LEEEKANALEMAT